MRLLGPLRERDFALLFCGTLISMLGDGIFLVAQAFAVLGRSSGPAALALVGVAWSVGMLGFLLIGGLLADRIDKRRLLMAADGVRLTALLAAGALDLSGALQIWHLAVLGFAYGVGEGLSGPAMGSILPELVPERILLQANALTLSLRPMAERLAGPALGGLTVALIGTGGAFLVDAATFAISIGCLLAMRARVRPVAEGGHEPLVAQLREAAAFVRTQTWLWGTLLLAAIALLVFLGPMEVLVPFRVKHDLGANAGAFGLVLAAGGAGTVLGTFLIGQLGTPRREISFLYWSWGIAGLSLCGFGLAQAVWQMVVIGLVYGLFNGMGNPVWGTLMQVRVPAHMRGRVASMDWLVSVGLTPVSFALTGPVGAAAGAGPTMVVCGLVAGGFTIGLLYVLPGLRAEDGGLSRAAAAPGRP
jgi:DHA3 family tetracycline resistance protein-like MFS transporter